MKNRRRMRKTERRRDRQKKERKSGDQLRYCLNNGSVNKENSLFLLTFAETKGCMDLGALRESESTFEVRYARLI